MPSLPIIIAIFSMLVFAVMAIIFSVQEQQALRLAKKRAGENRQPTYEAAVLRQVQDSFGYSLNIEKITDILTGNLINLMPYSSVSTLLLKNNNLIFNTSVKEPVNQFYIDHVKNIMLKSFQALKNEAPSNSIDEKLNGIPLDNNLNSIPVSFFNIPIFVNNKLEGLINISSTQPNFYQEETMTFLYKITDRIFQTQSKLQHILLTEKSRLTSLMNDLQDCVLLINADYKITAFNESAKNFLKIQKDNSDFKDILTNLPNSYNFLAKIEQAMNMNQKIEEKNIHFEDKYFNLIINPVLDSSSSSEPKVIGVSLFIHDVSPEKSLTKMKEDFANIIIHELRSPLTSIKASTEMLSKEANLPDDDRKSRQFSRLFFNLEQSHGLTDSC